MEPVVKPWWQSKSILVNILMGVALVVAQFKPEAAEFIKNNFGEAGVAWAFVNVILRMVTKDKVSIL
jgi:hypothetical protein